MRASALAARWAARLLVAGPLSVAVPTLALAPGYLSAQTPGGLVAPSQARLEAHKVELAWLADLTTFGHALEVVVAPDGLEVRGAVPDETVRQQALRVARQHSYLPVVDALTVAFPSAAVPASAEALQRAASEHLVREFGPRASGFEVTVTAAGQVVVRGSVASVEDKLAVSKALRLVPGCHAAVNHLSVASVLRAGQTVTLVSRDGSQMVSGPLPTSPTASLPVPPPTPHVPTVLPVSGVQTAAPPLLPRLAGPAPLPQAPVAYAPGSEPDELGEFPASLPRIRSQPVAQPLTLSSGLPARNQTVSLIAAPQPTAPAPEIRPIDPGAPTAPPTFYSAPTGYALGAPPAAVVGPAGGTTRTPLSVYPVWGCASCGTSGTAKAEAPRRPLRDRITALRATPRRETVVSTRVISQTTVAQPAPVVADPAVPTPVVATPAVPVPAPVTPAPAGAGAAARPAPRGVPAVSSYIKQPRPEVWPPAFRGGSTSPAATQPAKPAPGGSEQAAQPAAEVPAPQTPRLTPAPVPKSVATPLPATPAKVDTARLVKLVEKAGGQQMLRHVKVTVQPDRSLRVSVTVASAESTNAVVESILRVPEMAAPGVRLEVEVAP